MQKLKDDKKKLILTVAHQEFVNNGVRKTSIKQIATSSGVAVGNIYHYFHNKNEIYCAVMQPTIKALYKFIERYNGKKGLNIEFYSAEEYQQQMVDILLNFVHKHKNELRLLLFHSTGTSLENFRETLIAKQAEYGETYLEGMKKKYPHIINGISPLFLHFLCSMWVSMLSVLCMQESLFDEKAISFLKEFIMYGTAGWKRLMQI